MSRLPDVLADGRGQGISKVAALAVGQALAAGVAAFATRDVFSAFDEGATPGGALLLLLTAGLTIAALRVFERAQAEAIGQDYAASLRQTLYAHVSAMPARDVSRWRAGSLTLRFVGDLSAVRGWVSNGIARAISSAIVLPGALAALVLLNPAMAAAAAAPLLISLLLMAQVAPRLGPLHRRLRSRRAALAADMSERLPVAPALRLLGREQRESARLEHMSKRLRSAAVARRTASATLRALPDAGASAAAVLTLLTALSTGAPAGEAAAALATLGIVALPLRDLASVWERRRAFEVARDKCLSVLQREQIQRPGTGVRRTQGSAPGVLELEGVSGGGGDAEACALRVEPGERVALVGPNGAGKSTLLALAAGLEPVATAAAVLDGIDTRTLGPDAARHGVMLLDACTPILKGSLRRALTLGVEPRPADAQIEAAAHALGLGAVMERLDGLNGRVSEAGRNLSLGEARRVLLVRAALASPRLLLLDEPEKALDRAGRELVRQFLQHVRATTLVVTHDLRLARAVDRIWYVESGRVLEDGVPVALLGGDGRTARFFGLRNVA